MKNIATFNFAAVAVNNSTDYTTSYRFQRSTGDVCILVVTDAGTVNVSQQCSLDNQTWYDPINSSGSTVGAVATGQTVGSKYCVVTPVMAPHVRYKITETAAAATNVTLTLLSGEED